MTPLRTIETERLRIRRFRPEDLPAITPILDACFGVAPAADRAFWLDWQVKTYRALEAMHQPPYGDYAVEDDRGTLVGSVGLVQSFGPFYTVGIGQAHGATPELGLFWAIAPAHRGAGLATEAARALARWIFENLEAARLVATTDHDNLASQAVMRRLGMTLHDAGPDTPGWFQTVGVLERPGS